MRPAARFASPPIRIWPADAVPLGWRTPPALRGRAARRCTAAPSARAACRRGMDPRGAAPAGGVPEAGRSSSGVDATSLLLSAPSPRPSSAASRPRTPFLAGLLGNLRGEQGGPAAAADPGAAQALQARAGGSETQSVASNDSATQEALKKVRPCALRTQRRCRAQRWKLDGRRRAARHVAAAAAPRSSPRAVMHPRRALRRPRCAAGRARLRLVSAAAPCCLRRSTSPTRPRLRRPTR